MFLKYTSNGAKKNPKIYVQLVQSYRDKDGKPKHRVILNLGKKEDVLNSSIVDEIIKGLSKLSQDLMVIDKGEYEGASKMLGPVLAVEAIWKQLQLKDKFKDIQSDYKITYNLNKAVKLMVINRLTDPKSKLGIETWREKIHFDSQDIKLQHMYRSLDVLAENKEDIEEDLYATSISLFKPEIKVVFYDLTTAYFDSDKVDNLRKTGYGKDHRKDCTKVVIGLIMSKDGFPLGYDVFPGGTYEGHTVEPMLEKLKRRYKIGKLIFVGDRGLLSKKILKNIAKNKYEYIVAAKLKGLPRKYHERILDRSQYRQIGEGLWLSEMKYDGHRLILGYSDIRANRDRKKREKILKNLQNKINDNSVKSVVQPYYAHFLSIDTNEVKIDPAKVESNAKWDGFFGYHTNNKEFTQEEVLDSYKLLWQVEDSFRHLKSTLKMRPMFHWNNERIKGHIMVCFLSFYILKVIERKIKSQNLEISVKSALQELEDIRTVEIKDKTAKFIARTEISGIKTKILRSISCKIPKPILQETVVTQK